jgi:hypothetical protein
MLQQFFDQHLMIALPRDKEPMAVVSDGRGGGWVVDQAAHQRREIGRRGGYHCWGGKVDTLVTRLGRRTAIVIPTKSFQLIGDPMKAWSRCVSCLHSNV